MCAGARVINGSGGCIVTCVHADGWALGSSMPVVVVLQRACWHWGCHHR